MERSTIFHGKTHYKWPFSEGRHHFPETIRNPNIIAHFETKHRSTKYATGLPLPVLGARNVVNLGLATRLTRKSLVFLIIISVNPANWEV
jgi:hypothetical protein